MNPFPRAELFLNWLLQQSLNTSIVVVLVILLQWLFKKHLTARWRFALWWVVLCSLLLPVRPSSSFSLFNYCQASAIIQGTRYDVSTHPQGEPVLAASHAAENKEPQTAQVDYPLAATEVSEVVPESNQPVIMSPEAKPQRSFWNRFLGIPGRELGWDDLILPGLIVGWLLGMLALSFYAARVVLQFRRQLAGRCVSVSAEVRSVFDDCARLMEVRRHVELWETDAVKSPALYGLFRLQLLLPKGFAATFTEAELRHIFLHELAHVKRGDMWLNWLVTGLQIFHWFNPVIWFAFARLRADRELACDELALIHSGETEGQNYGQTILKLLENLNQVKPMPGLVGIVEDRKQMAQRLKTIAAFRLPSKWSRLAVLLVIGLALVGLTGAQTTTSKSAKPEENHNIASTNATPTRAAVFHFRFVDAENSQPITNITVATGLFRGALTVRKQVESPDGRVPWDLNEKDQAWLFKTDGYEELFLKNVMVFSLIDDVEIKLKRSKAYSQPLAGKVLLPDGKPARFASVTTRGFGGPNLLEFTTVEASENGDFILPDEKGVLLLMVEHEKGFAQVKVADFRLNPVIRLQPFGRINGRLGLEDKLKVGDRLSLSPLLATVGNAPVPIDLVRFKTAVNADGSYQFDNIPAGEYRVQLERPDPNYQGKDDLFAASPRIVLIGFVKVEPDATAKIDRLPKGVNVKARLIVPPGTDSWEWGQYRLSGSLISTVATNGIRRAAVDRTDFDNPYWKSEAYRAECLAYRYYPIDILPGGLIQIEDVTPGTYYLSLSVFPHQKTTTQTNEWLAIRAVASIQKNGLVIPVGAPTMDIGELLLERKAAQVTTPKSNEKQAVIKEKEPLATNEFRQSAEKAESVSVKNPLPQTYKGKVLLPDGTPALGAQVAFITSRWRPLIGKQSFIPSNGPNFAKVDSDGGFQFSVADCLQIAAINETGHVQVSIEDFNKDSVLKLQPWGRVEGTLHVGDKLAAGQKLYISSIYIWSEGSTEPRLSPFEFRTETDSSGRFAFDYLPAGEFRFYKSARATPTNSWTSTFLESSYCTDVKVSPGNTNVLLLGGSGIHVVGRVSFQKRPWDWDNTRLVASLEMNPFTLPPNIRKDSPADLEAYNRSSDFKKAIRAHLYYSLSVKEDGAIEAWDMPPGKYLLSLEVKQKPSSPSQPLNPNTLEVLATFKKDVVIPEPVSGKPAVFDLGEMTLVPAK